MKRIGRKIIAFLCVAGLMLSNLGSMGFALPATYSQNLTATDDKTYRVTVTAQADADAPEALTLQVEPVTSGQDSPYDGYVEQAAAELRQQVSDFRYARAFALALTNASGQTVQPAQGAKVRLELLDEDLGKSDELALFSVSGGLRKLDCQVKNGAVEFTPGALGVFLLTRTAPETTLTATAGQVTVTVTYGEDAGLPANTRLILSEPASSAEDYKATVDAAKAAVSDLPSISGFTRVLNLSLQDADTEQPVQPSAGVQVSVKLGDVTLSDHIAVDVVHVSGESAQRLSSRLLGETIRFTTESFSSFVLLEAPAYTITWKNADNTVLKTDRNVRAGETPSYQGVTPTKAPTAEQVFTFSGWTPAVVPAAADATYTAAFTDSPRPYTMTWKDEDGTVLGTSEAGYGTLPEYTGATPTKEQDVQYTYAFSGWEPALTAVTGDAAYQAVYEATPRNYTITWLNEDGTQLGQTQVPYGTVPAYTGAAPTKEQTPQYTYTFKGWEPEPVAVTGEATYTAAFEETLRTYTVTWVNYDDSLLRKDVDVPYGTVPDYGGTPIRTEDTGNKYTFSYWDPEPSAITGDVTYKATYTAAPIELCLQDQRTHQPFAGARFTLTNSAGVVVWTSAETTDNGVLWIPKVENEVAGGAGAVFANGSTYTLKQIATNAAHYLPQGTWTLTVDDKGAFALKRNSQAGDVSTWEASGPYGIRFYLYNVSSSRIIYDYNYPEGVSGQPEDQEFLLGFLAYDGAYQVPLDDPALEGYEFAGWIVDGTTLTAKKGETVELDTVNVPEHTMAAAWRVPLQVQAFTYAGGSPEAAGAVAESASAYRITAEKPITFAGLEAVAAAYGQQNAAVAGLNSSEDYSFAFAAIRKDGALQRITALRYDTAVHGWQYRTAGQGTVWLDLALGEELGLYYVSTVVSVRWVLEDDFGAFAPLPGRSGPMTVAVGSAWTDYTWLIPSEDRPVVDGLAYYRSMGVGPRDAASATDLEESGLQSFALRNTEEGFLFRAGSSGEGTLLSGSTIYLIYSKTPPEGSTALEIKNRTEYPYQLHRLLLGAEADNNDLLARSAVVLVGDESLQLVSPDTQLAPGAEASLVLLSTGAKAFVLDGGFVEAAPQDTVVSIGVLAAGKMTRTAVAKNDEGNGLAATGSVTRGMLEAAPGKVVITLDDQLSDVTLIKTWSEDAYPEHYEVDLALYEDGVPCVTADSHNGLYTVKPSDWTLTLPYLPDACTYQVAEQAVRRVQNKTTVADETGEFTPTYSREDRTLTVYNQRSSEVCRVNGTLFRTIREAVAYITANDLHTATIEMLDNYIMAASGAVTIPAGYDVTLTTAPGLDTKRVTRGFSGGDMFLVEGSLTVKDLTVTGKLDDVRYANDGNGGLFTVTGGDLTLGEGTLLTGGRAVNGSAVYVTDAGTLTLDGARITDNQAVSGGAIGIGDADSRVFLTGDTYVYNNRDGDNRNQYNIYLDQDSNEVLQVSAAGLGDSAQIGVYCPSATYDGHGAPAKPFATFAEGGDRNLEKLINDRLSSGPSKTGSASTLLPHTVVWGETFSFTVTVQWLDEHLEPTTPPADGEVSLKLNGGSVTPGADVTATVNASTGWTVTFEALAKYNGSGYPYEYRIQQTGLTPSTYRQIIFTGDKATSDDPLTYSPASGDSQRVIVSEYYRYTQFTVHKVAQNIPEGQSIRSTFALYRVLKDGVDNASAIRKGGLGGLNDLPLSLRGGVSSLWGSTAALEDTASVSLPQTDRFFTVDGGNRWYIQLAEETRTGAAVKQGVEANVSGSLVKFHRFYDQSLGQFTAQGGAYTLNGGSWQPGDVISVGGAVSVYGNDHAWHALSASASVTTLSFDRQDGYTGVESVGGQSADKTCVIENSGDYTFDLERQLSSDYYYYAVETQVQEIGGPGRTIGDSHKLVAVYDPRYVYDQLAAEQTVTNTRRDFLSVDKRWGEDANQRECVFEVYEAVGATEDQITFLNDAARFEKLVKGQDISGVTLQFVTRFSLPEPTGSWVHVLEELDTSKIYFVRETSAGGMPIMSPDVKDNGAATDAVYSYDYLVNQITVRNLSDILCKIDDKDGENPFRTLNAALEYGRTRTNGESNNTFTIQMLRDYSIPASDIMQMKDGEHITLTTASTETGFYRYEGKNGATKATITRGGGNAWSFFVVNSTDTDSSHTTFTLENIAFNGGSTGVSYKISNTWFYYGGVVYAKNADITLRDGVEVRYAKANSGGAVYATGGNVTVSDSLFEFCEATERNDNNRSGGGAIWTNGAQATVTDSTFTSCVSARVGSAVASVNDSSDLTVISGCTFTDCVSGPQHGGTVYSRSMRLEVGGSAANPESAFLRCSAGYWGGGVYHDNMKAGSEAVITHSAFTQCSTTAGGTSENQRHGGGGVCANSDHLTLDYVTFTGCDSYIRGGGALHFNLAASTSTVTHCTFLDCVTQTSGGGGLGDTALVQTISDCTFTDCKALTSAGGGLDIACFNIDKDAVVERCLFDGCEAFGSNRGGGICFGGRSLEVRETTFRACISNGSDGGGISVSAGGSQEELLVYGCTFEDCAALKGSGGSIYTNSILLRLEDAVSSTDGTVTHTSFLNSRASSSGGSIFQTPPSGSAENFALLAENVVFADSRAESTGGAIYANAATVSIQGLPETTAFRHCTSGGTGGAICHNSNLVNAHLTVEDCGFERCASDKSGGGAIYTYGPFLDLDSDAFDQCTAQSGGAVYQNVNNGNALPGSYAKIDGSWFHDCSVTQYSGAIYTNALGVTIQGDPDLVTFENCQSVTEGGAVYHDRTNTDAFTELTDCSFIHCASSEKAAGALYSRGLNHVTIRRGVFRDCSAKQSGGGVYTTSPHLTLEDVTFEECVTRESGGGFCQNTDGKYLEGSFVTAEETWFHDCTANSNGGGLWANAQQLTVTGEEDVTTFLSCTANSNGGGLFHNRGSTGVLHLTDCAFEDCHAVTQNGGGIYTYAGEMVLENDSFQSCTSRGNGGSVIQDVNNANYVSGSLARITGTWFHDSQSENGSGGALISSAETLKLTGDPAEATFLNCTARNYGGAISHNRDREGSSTEVTGCTFENCTVQVERGGAIYLVTDHVTIRGEADRTTFRNCIANNTGGAISQEKGRVDSSFTLEDCSFDTCTSVTGAAGAVRTETTQFTVTGSSFAHCTARSSGGAIYRHLQINDQIPVSTDLYENTTFTDCHSLRENGGALQTEGLAITIRGEAGKDTFYDCSCAKLGGAIYHNRTHESTSFTMSDCTVRACTAQTETDRNGYGGAAYLRAREVTLTDSSFLDCLAQYDGGFLYLYRDNYVAVVTITGCTFSNGQAVLGSGGGIFNNKGAITLWDTTVENCTAGNNGGGLYQTSNSSQPMTLDHCTVTGNTAKNYGGGVFFDPQNELTLRNGTSVTGNHLLVETVANGAGIYISQNSVATLVLGGDGIGQDTLTVYDNTTSLGEQSNVRLSLGPWNSKAGKNQNRETSVSLLSDLVKPGIGATGSIGVCDPGPENTRFGLGDVSGHTGVEYIISDIDTLRGMLDPSDKTKKIIIWYAPPVCKITDQNGQVLTYQDGDVPKPAVFSRLKDAFDAVNVLTEGYFHDNNDVVPSQLQLQMLVSEYPLEASMPELKRDITLTTAAPGPGEYDYPLSATSAQSTIVRGKNAKTSMFTVGSGVELQVTGITLDGGSNTAQHLTASSNGGILLARSDAVIHLGENAVLQNAQAAANYSGGAVYVTGGTDPTKPALVLEKNATIRNCSARDGGAVYLTGNVLCEMNDAPHIEDCSATRYGGAVYVAPYATLSFRENPNGVIRGNTITDPSGKGAGIYLGSSASRLDLRLGANASFADNTVSGSEDSARTNGGEEYPLLRQDIYLAETADPVTSLHLTGDLAVEKGSIWVWAEAPIHYLSEMQFAVIEEGVTVTDSTLKAFRDARDDETLGNRSGQFLTGNRGDNELYVYWGVEGLDVRFKKIDGYGAALTGATFTVYTDPACTVPLERLGERITATSADGAQARDADSVLLPKGQVYFEKVPTGTYFLKETAIPAGYSNGETYILLVGNADLMAPQNKTGPWAALLEDITPEDVTAQTGTGDDDTGFAIFLLDPDTNKAVTTPDIARYGVLNESTTTRRVILKKSDDQYDPLSGATFDILRYDRSVVAEDQVSGAAGALWIGQLPYGTYYLHEKIVPAGMSSGPDGLWFTLRVDQNGAALLHERDTSPWDPNQP